MVIFNWKKKTQTKADQMGKQKIEAGQGGKLGHSNMTHWTGTEEIKVRTKSLRRQQGKKIIHSALKTGGVE